MNLLANRFRRLLRTGFFHIFGGSAINKIIGFLSSIVLVRILTKSEYGVFTYAWNIYCLVMLANGLGLDSGVLQLCSENSGDHDYAAKIYSFGTKKGIIFDVLLCVILLGIGLFAPLKIHRAKLLIISLCVLPIIQFIYNIDLAFLRSQKRNKDFARLSVLNTILVFAVSALGAFLLREAGMILGHYIAYLVCVLVATLTMHIKIITNDSMPSIEDRKALLSISAVSMCNNGLSQLMYLLDVFVLGIVAAEETVLASYKVATVIPTALSFVPAAMITYLYPYFAEHKDDGKWCIDNYKKVLIGMGGLNAFLSIVLLVGAPLIVKILYGEQYLDAVPVFRILSINFFLSGTFRTLSGNLLVTQRKLKFNLVVAIIAGLTNVITDYLFIQWWGSTGAALATVMVVLVSSVMSTTYLVYTLRQKSKA